MSASLNPGIADGRYWSVSWPLAAGAFERGPVDREVHRLPELRVVAEERPGRVERVAVKGKSRLDPEPRLVDAVLLGQPSRRVEDDRVGREAPVGVATLDLVEHLLGRGRSQVDEEAVDVVRALPAVVGVALDHDPLARTIVGHEVRPRAGEGADSLGVGRQLRRDGTEKRHRGLRREVRNGSLEADDEGVAAGDDPSRALRLPVLNILGPHDGLRVLGTRRVDPRCQCAVDCAGKGACPHGSAV